MLFNSIDFGIFLPIVFVLYWFVTNRSLKLQNFFIVVASYVFYGWWDWRFLSLIFFSSVVDYTIGVLLSKEEDGMKRKILLYSSMVINLGILGYFKYFNFFIDNFAVAFTYFGADISSNSLNLILPVGISFYTFQTMSYTIDVYKNKLFPTRDFIAFAAFVSFFPQLVAGPIERATNLIPQFLEKRFFDKENAIKGIRLILYGLMKKVVIADLLAPSINDIFRNYEQYPSHILLLGAVLFSFQIYCDFSGYSMIARGVAKLFGFELMINFNFPYYSRNIAEFWRKWHISLSTWFRDYLYIPIGGSKGTLLNNIRNVTIVFLVSGFWHGANWTFIVWGAIHALLFVPSMVNKNNRKFLDKIQLNGLMLPSFKETLMILRTFILVTFCWIFFRADSVDIATNFILKILELDFSRVTYLNPYDNQPLNIEILFLFVFIIIEYLISTEVIKIFSSKRYYQIIIDSALLLLITISSQIGTNLSFIYFQF